MSSLVPLLDAETAERDEQQTWTRLHWPRVGLMSFLADSTHSLKCFRFAVVLYVPK